MSNATTSAGIFGTPSIIQSSEGVLLLGPGSCLRSSFESLALPHHSGSGVSPKSIPGGTSSNSSNFCISIAWKSIGGIGIRRCVFLLLTEPGRPLTSQYRSYQSRTMPGLTKPWRRFATDGASSPFSNRSFAVIRKILFKLVAPFVLTRLAARSTA